MRRHISGREATYMPIESDKCRPMKIEALPADAAPSPPAVRTKTIAGGDFVSILVEVAEEKGRSQE